MHVHTINSAKSSRNDEVIQVGIIDLNGNVLLNTLVRPTVPVAPEARERGADAI